MSLYQNTVDGDPPSKASEKIEDGLPPSIAFEPPRPCALINVEPSEKVMPSEATVKPCLTIKFLSIVATEVHYPLRYTLCF